MYIDHHRQVPTPTPERPSKRKKATDKNNSTTDKGYVFDPVIGVVPEEMAMRWKNERRRNLNLKNKSTSLPPVRYQD